VLGCIPVVNSHHKLLSALEVQAEVTEALREPCDRSIK
jgi:hypothetical protein